MPARWKPTGYTTVSPYLIARGSEEVIDFLKKAFDADELRRFEMDDGSIMHAEVGLAGSTFLVYIAAAPDAAAATALGAC